jgi:hypothetical protein
LPLRLPRSAARAAAVAAVAAALTACGTYTYTAPPTPSPTPTQSGPIEVSDPGQVTQVTGQPAGPCHVRDGGQLPDPRCTPGAYDPQVTAETLCDPSYSTRSYRPPSSQTSRFKWGTVAPAYGIEDRPVAELDHLINLDLAGSNDGANLWIEVGKIPNRKDAVEGDLHDWVCEGGTAEVRATRLRDAQLAIASDWETAKAVLALR